MAGFLVLAEPSDRTAIAVAATLRRRHGPGQVEIRTATELALAPRWAHRLGEGQASTRIVFHDGSVLDDRRPAVIFNRLAFVAPPGTARMSAADRAYAQAEMAALVASWLAGAHCRVVNAPSSAAMTACVHRPLAWQRFAAAAGLETATVVASSSTRRFPPPAGAMRRPDLTWRPAGALSSPRPNGFGWYGEPLDDAAASALVIGERVIGDVDEPLARGCVRLARLAGADLLRVDFARRRAPRAPLVFTRANAMPSASTTAEISALADFLEAAA